MNLESIILIIRTNYKNYLQKYYHAKDETERQKFIAYFYLTISLFTLSFFGFFAIRPTIITIVNLNRQLKDGQEVLQKIIQKKETLAKLTSQYESMQNDIPLIARAIPSSPNIPYLSRQIETVALKNNIILTSLNFGSIDIGQVKKGSLMSFGISITAEGTENDVNLFIRQLASMDRLLGFEKLTTGKTRKSAYGGVIVMKGYFLPE